MIQKTQNMIANSSMALDVSAIEAQLNPYLTVIAIYLDISGGYFKVFLLTINLGYFLVHYSLL